MQKKNHKKFGKYNNLLFTKPCIFAGNDLFHSVDFVNGYIPDKGKFNESDQADCGKWNYRCGIHVPVSVGQC